MIRFDDARETVMKIESTDAPSAGLPMGEEAFDEVIIAARRGTLFIRGGYGREEIWLGLAPDRRPNAAAALTVRKWIDVVLGVEIYQPDFTLNVAGNRESRAHGIERRVRGILIAALRGIA
jgi:hypothetical protein